MKYSVIIPAAGSGKRMGLGFNKVFAKIDDLPMIIKTMKIFDQPECEKIVVVYQEQDKSHLEELINDHSFKTDVCLVEGGKERLNSVNNGLQVVESNYVLIHDGARPFLSNKSLQDVLEKLKTANACLLAVKAKDTIKVVAGGVVTDTPLRETMYLAQTPQAFKTSLIKECYQKAIESEEMFTDDASIAERYNVDVHIVEGEYSNIKVTTKEDL
jgi:2-C-methyl-D-erythritol 4-phosphate cytidylyltransferase